MNWNSFFFLPFRSLYNSSRVLVAEKLSKKIKLKIVNVDLSLTLTYLMQIHYRIHASHKFTLSDGKKLFRVPVHHIFSLDLMKVPSVLKSWRIRNKSLHWACIKHWKYGSSLQISPIIHCSLIYYFSFSSFTYSTAMNGWNINLAHAQNDYIIKILRESISPFTTSFCLPQLWQTPWL